jgi:hypothetical protein
MDLLPGRANVNSGTPGAGTHSVAQDRTLLSFPVSLVL